MRGAIAVTAVVCLLFAAGAVWAAEDAGERQGDREAEAEAEGEAEAGGGGDDGIPGFNYQPGWYVNMADKLRPVVGAGPMLVHDYLVGAPPATEYQQSGVWSTVADTVDATTGHVPDEVLPEVLKPWKGGIDALGTVAGNERDYQNRQLQRGVDAVSQDPVAADAGAKQGYERVQQGKPYATPFSATDTRKPTASLVPYKPGGPIKPKPKPLTEDQWAAQAQVQRPLDTNTLKPVTSTSGPKQPLTDINAGKPRLTPDQIQAGIDPNDPASDPLNANANANAKPQSSNALPQQKPKPDGADAAVAGAKDAAKEDDGKEQTEEPLNGNVKSDITARVKKALSDEKKKKQPKQQKDKKKQKEKQKGKKGVKKQTGQKQKKQKAKAPKKDKKKLKTQKQQKAKKQKAKAKAKKALKQQQKKQKQKQKKRDKQPKVKKAKTAKKAKAKKAAAKKAKAKAKAKKPKKTPKSKPSKRSATKRAARGGAKRSKRSGSKSRRSTRRRAARRTSRGAR